jgi:N-alpha-acetyltransferase 50
MPQREHSSDFGDLTEKNLGQLKILNAAIFPVKYNDKFYTDLLLPGREELTKLGT